MVYRFKYWIPLLGALLFHFDYCIIHNINLTEKYPFFVIYHAMSLITLMTTIFNLMVS
jgi:hypothetical protein